MSGITPNKPIAERVQQRRDELSGDAMGELGRYISQHEIETLLELVSELRAETAGLRNEVATKTQTMLTLTAQVEKLSAEHGDYVRMIHSVIRNCKRFPDTYNDGEPGAMAGPLWHRVGEMVGLGSTSSYALCREFGEDPEWQPVATPEGKAT